MFKKLRSFTIILTILSLVGCVSIPFQPANHTEECKAYYFQTKRQVTEVFDENTLTIGLVVTLSLLNSAFSPIFLAPILSTPYIHYKNKVKSDEILNQWKVEKCGMTGKKETNSERPPVVL
ncbi:MAG: hypothetical protein IBJ01_08710 [Leptospira sp.]|uniref:hypothetical protein n=1 Tax=Leptospira sp. TaxID=178 RepID=UPI0025BA2114|nr:hypothetical protein [Leptospira sp.]MBL0954830.1 hypothetical protein [Leptospira sp.]